MQLIFRKNERLFYIKYRVTSNGFCLIDSVLFKRKERRGKIVGTIHGYGRVMQANKEIGVPGGGFLQRQ